MNSEPTAAITAILNANGYPAPEKTEALRGDASTRRYFSITIAPAPDTKQHLIAMVLPPNSAELFDLIAQTQAFFKKLGCFVPEIYARDKERGIFIMEHLGSTDMEAVLLGGARMLQTQTLYKQAIDILLRIQSADCDTEKSPGFTPFTLAFDEEKLMWEMNFFIKHYLEGHKKAQISKPEKQELLSVFEELCREISAQPRVLTHRDYHCRNLMIKDAILRTIDFQDARMGPRQYDLASLLRDSYFVLDNTTREQLIDYYITELDKQNHFETNRANFMRVFELVALQRNIKALGTFGYMLTRAGKEHFLSAVEPTVQYIKDAPENIAVIAKLKSQLVPLL